MNEKDDQEKESFYENLEDVYNRIPRYDMVIIIGEFNAKIDTQDYQQQVVGPIKYMILTMKMVICLQNLQPGTD